MLDWTGPEIPFTAGRKDATNDSACPPEHMLPDGYHHKGKRLRSTTVKPRPFLPADNGHQHPSRFKHQAISSSCLACVCSRRHRRR